MISSYIKNILENDGFDREGFVIRDNLHPDFWDDDGKLKEHIRRRLITIAKDFFESIGLPNMNIKDVTFTGSLANYNWSRFSDIDLHIIADFAEIDENEDLVREMFNGKKIYLER